MGGRESSEPGVRLATSRVPGTCVVALNFRLKRLQLIPPHEYNPNILDDKASKSVNRE